jgi:Na+/H+ antiporter NhaD/arsenite permease-like protein
LTDCDWDVVLFLAGEFVLFGFLSVFNVEVVENLGGLLENGEMGFLERNIPQ